MSDDHGLEQLDIELQKKNKLLLQELKTASQEVQVLSDEASRRMKEVNNLMREVKMQQAQEEKRKQSCFPFFRKSKNKNKGSATSVTRRNSKGY